MKRLFPYLFIFLVVAILSAGCGKSGRESAKNAPVSKFTIAVIPKGTTHEFWKSIHAGAVKAADETGVDIVWKGPLIEDDREEQLQIVETFVAGKISAIVLAPLDNRSLIVSVREAKTQGIPTVVIDSDLEGKDHVSFIATDNYKGGVLGAERIGALMGGRGTLIMLRYQEGSASTTNREAGFLDTVKSKFPGIKILSDNQYAGATTESAYRASETLLNRFGDVNAIFTPNESSTFGCLRALQDRELTKKIIFVGFDSSEKLVQALEAGEIRGLVLQNPFKMGYLGVKTAVAYLKGETVAPVIDTGVTIATPENMNDPEIRQLLSPDLTQYLNR